MRKELMEKYVIEVMEFFNCNKLTIVDGAKWYGDYGAVCDTYNGFLDYRYYGESIKNIYKNTHKIFNNTRVHQDDRICVTDDNVLILFNNAHRSKYNEDLYILSNGQIYDCCNRYWYDIHDSKKIKKLLKNGYIYTDPYDYFNYQCPKDDDDYPLESDEESYWVEE